MRKTVLLNGRKGIWRGFTSIPSFDILKAFPRSMDFVRRCFQKMIWSINSEMISMEIF